MRNLVKVVAYLLILFGMMAFIACAKSGNTTKSDNTEVAIVETTPTPAAEPVYATVTGTTKDMNGNVIGVEKKVIDLLTVAALPDMTNMYEMFAGIQLELDLDLKALLEGIVKTYNEDPQNFTLDSIMNDMMGSIIKTPLLVQGWALKQMKTSVAAGNDNAFTTSDDTIDPMLGYWLTEKNADGTYTQISYSDYGVTQSGRLDYQVVANKKVTTYKYGAGSDGIYGTSDDVLVRITDFKYNAAGKVHRAINYNVKDGVALFDSVYKFTYDELGQLVSMYSYRDPKATKRLGSGSYTTLKWGKTEAGKKTLDLTIGMLFDFNTLADLLDIKVPWGLWLRIAMLGGIDINFMNFHYEFNDDGTIHKMIQYKSLSSTDIETCYVYGYSGTSLLSASKQNDDSKNYSDDETTQKSLTENILDFGIK